MQGYIPRAIAEGKAKPARDPSAAMAPYGTGGFPRDSRLFLILPAAPTRQMHRAFPGEPNIFRPRKRDENPNTNRPIDQSTNQPNYIIPSVSFATSDILSGDQGGSKVMSTSTEPTSAMRPTWRWTFSGIS